MYQWESDIQRFEGDLLFPNPTYGAAFALSQVGTPKSLRRVIEEINPVYKPQLLSSVQHLLVDEYGRKRRRNEDELNLGSALTPAGIFQFTKKTC